MPPVVLADVLVADAVELAPVVLAELVPGPVVPAPAPPAPSEPPPLPPSSPQATPSRRKPTTKDATARMPQHWHDGGWGRSPDSTQRVLLNASSWFCRAFDSKGSAILGFAGAGGFVAGDAP